MAATGTPTPNIGLRIPQGTDPASVDDINYNSTLIDTKLGAVGNDSVQDQIDDLNSKIANVANYAFGTAKVVEAISITQNVIFIAKIDCSNLVPNNKVIRILGAWVGINPAGNEMMVAQAARSNYVEVYMKSNNTQNISANSDVTVALLYKN